MKYGYIRKVGVMVIKDIGSNNFCTEILNILTITKAVYKLIKFRGKNELIVDELYLGMDNMLGEINMKFRKISRLII